jgi:hypothetical protein
MNAPIRMIAAFALLPHSNPSIKPAAAATIFFNAPHKHTPATS